MDRRRPRNVPARPLVLVVDGDKDTRELYHRGLSSLGFEVIATDNEPERRFQRAVDEFARQKGFAAVFPKPCLPEVLAAGIRQVLNAQAGLARAITTR